MLSPFNIQSLVNTVRVDERNKRLVINGYESGTKPSLLSQQILDLAVQNKMGKVWLWALPADVPEFIRRGFQIEGSLFLSNYEEFCISLAYFTEKERGVSRKVETENEIFRTVSIKPIHQPQRLPLGIELKLLNESYGEQISHVMTQVFASYPSPVEDPQYICSLMQKGNIFAGAICQGEIISIAAAYPDPLLKRCEMTDCATIETYRGYSLSERLLSILEHEVNRRGSYNLYTLARAQSYGMNRVFHKLGYRFQGRLINNCHIAGAFEDMNLLVK